MQQVVTKDSSKIDFPDPDSLAGMIYSAIDQVNNHDRLMHGLRNDIQLAEARSSHLNLSDYLHARHVFYALQTEIGRGFTRSGLEVTVEDSPFVVFASNRLGADLKSVLKAVDHVEKKLIRDAENVFMDEAIGLIDPSEIDDGIVRANADNPALLKDYFSHYLKAYLEEMTFGIFQVSKPYLDHIVKPHTLVYLAQTRHDNIFYRADRGAVRHAQNENDKKFRERAFRPLFEAAKKAYIRTFIDPGYT